MRPGLYAVLSIKAKESNMKDKFQPLSTAGYLLAVVVHNWHILFGKMQLMFYKLFDQMECFWYVRVRRFGSKGDYHLGKMASNIKNDPQASKELQRQSMIFSLVSLLYAHPHDIHKVMRVFYPLMYMRFAWRKWFFQRMEIVFAVEDEKDLLRAGDLLGFGFRAKIQSRYGLDILNEYESKGNLHELLSQKTQ